MPYELQHAGYLISDDPARLDVDAVHAYLSRSYWSPGIPREVVATSLANSLCLGIYAGDGAQVGLVRIITDSATFAYVCDVYVLEEHRGHGLAKAAVNAMTKHPRTQGLRRWHLVTRDAHSLYSRVGFATPKFPDRHMERLNSDAYAVPKPASDSSGSRQ